MIEVDEERRGAKRSEKRAKCAERFRGETSGPGQQRTMHRIRLRAWPRPELAPLVRRCVFNYSIIHPAIHHQPSVKFILFLCIGPLQLATMYQLLISHDLFGARGIPSSTLLRQPIFRPVPDIITTPYVPFDRSSISNSSPHCWLLTRTQNFSKTGIRIFREEEEGEKLRVNFEKRILLGKF